MFSKSEGNIQQQQSMLGYSPAAQPMQFVLHPLIPANMPVVVDHVPRMPVTVLPAQPVTMSQPPRVNNKFVLQPSYQTNPSEPVQTTFTTLHLTPTTQVAQQTVQVAQPVSHITYSSVPMQDFLDTADKAPDAMQIFAERAEKSGIRLEALDPDTRSKAKKESHARQSHSLGTITTPSQSAGAAALSISSPEFVPRGPRAVMDAQYSDTMLGKYGMQNFVPHPLAFVNSGTNILTSSSSSTCDGYSDTVSTDYLPEQLANLSVGENVKPDAWPYRTSRRRCSDASTQTVKVNLVDVCTGGSSVLLVDSSTNTLQFDETGGLQQAQIVAEVSRASPASSYETAVDATGTGNKVQNRPFVVAKGWADNWNRQQQSLGSAGSDKESKRLFTNAAEYVAIKSDSRESSCFQNSREVPDTLPKSYSANVHHEMHSSSFRYELPTPSVAYDRNMCQQDADASSSLFASEPEQIPEQDFSPRVLEDEEIYYSDNDADFFPTDGVNDAASVAENFPNPEPAEVHHNNVDHAYLLSQLSSGVLPSQATIELATAQLLEALTPDEKQLMGPLVQQMALMNPILAVKPLALQVEAIRILLKSRSQRASGMGVQQVAQEAQNPEIGVSAGAAVAAEPTGVVTAHAQNYQAEASACTDHYHDVPSQLQLPSSHRTNDVSTHIPVPKHEDSFTSDTNCADECGSAFSERAWLGELRPTKGRGRGITGFQYEADVCCQNYQRGRGLRRGRAGMAEETRSLSAANSSASVHPPLVPPPLRTGRRSFPEGKPDVNDSENWDAEIDEFKSEVFCVDASYFKSGKR